MDQSLLQLVMALIAALGYALWSNVRPGLLIPAMFGGVVSWGTFLIISQFFEGPFVPCLFASALSALYAEVLASHFKVPSSIFFIVSVIPLIPGRLLFYTMSSAVIADWAEVGAYAFKTFQYAAAIAIGISVVWAIFEVIAEAHDRKFWRALKIERLRKAHLLKKPGASSKKADTSK